MNDALGDRMKEYERAYASQKLMRKLPAVARIDGRAFSKFTMGLERPYDERLSRLMIATTKYLVDETGACCGYTQSDEITLAWYSPTTEKQIFFDGRVQKMESVLAGLTSTYFLYNLTKFLPEQYARKLPHFDARVWNVPTLEEGANVFLWREWDATKNSVSMAAQHYYSHNDLMNKNGSDKQEMLWQKGVNWNDYPDFFKRGTYVQRQVVIKPFTPEIIARLPANHEARQNPDLTFERQECMILPLPPLARVANRIEVIFYGADCLTLTVEEAKVEDTDAGAVE